MDKLNKIIEGIMPLDKDAMAKAGERLDSLIKPIGSLGRLEDMAMQLAGIRGSLDIRLTKKCTIVMCADNGVVAEGVSACPSEVTAIQTVNILKGLAGINVLSKTLGADVRVVDIGIQGQVSYPGLIHRKVKAGTGNMAYGPAMTREEGIQGMEVGMEMVEELVQDGYAMLGTGEMGIGNTSTSSAILMAFTGCPRDHAVGKGAGMTEEGYQQKQRVIEGAVALNQPDSNDPLDVLSKVGGLDIAGLVGCYLGAAYHRVPIVIDGLISAAAALVAYKIQPLTREFMIPSHRSAEPGYGLIMKELGLEPILHLGMRLGEGTGCPLTFPIVESAAAILREMATFEQLTMDTDYLIDIR